MNPRTFAYQLCAWLDPAELVRCAWAFGKIDEWDTASFQALHLSEGSLAGLEKLARDLAENFRIPPEAIAFVRGSFASTLPAATWDWMAELRFDGKMEFQGIDPGYPPI